MADHSSSSSSLQKKPINTIEHKDTLGSDRDHKEALNSDNDNTSGLKINGVPIEDAREEVLLPGYLSKQYYKLYGLCFVTYLCATMQGYDGSLMGSIYTENAYLKYYHLDINSSTGTGLVFSIFNVGQICGAFFIDKIGRREGFLGSISGAALALTGLSICTARYEKTKKKSASNGALVFIYLFGVIFSFAFTPMQSMYSTEVSTNLMRSKAQLLNGVVSGAAQFVNQFAAPKAMKNIKYWFYVFYVFFDIFEFIVIYFFFVETKGRSLEELEAVFEAPNPRKASVDQAFLAQVRATLVQQNDVRVANAQNLKEQELLKSDADHVEKLSEAESV